MLSQKDVVKALDRAACRAGDAGASPKQTWYLAGLIAASPTAEKDYEDWLLSGQALCRAEASSLIEFYKNGRSC